MNEQEAELQKRTKEALVIPDLEGNDIQSIGNAVIQLVPKITYTVDI